MPCAAHSIFSETVDEEFICCACHGVIVDPCELPCGHDCGRSCLPGNENGAMGCPVCNSIHSAESVVSLKKISRLTAKLQVVCEKGCDWKGVWGALENHMSFDCAEFEVPCPFRCGVRVKRSQIGNHRRDCTLRTESCTHCLRPFKFVDVALHEERCPMRTVQCLSCGVEKRREQLKMHAAVECPNTTIVCPFADYGCSAQVTRGSVTQHVASALESHCQLLLEQVRVERIEANKSVSLLTDRIQVLERELRGQHAVNGVPLQAVVEGLQHTVSAQQDVIDQFLTGSVIVVDVGGKCGMFSLIADAIRECREGDTILLRQGVYNECITLAKPGVMVRGSLTESVILCGTVTLGGTSILSNVTLRQCDGNAPALRISGGSPQVRSCSITSVNLSCVIVDDGAPTISNCSISGSLQYGVCWRTAQHGTLQDCSVVNNAQGNIVVENGSINIEKCDIHQSAANGIMLKKNTKATLISSTVHDNKYSNVDVMPGAFAEVISSTIYRSEKCGLYVAGAVEVELSKIFDNKMPNVIVLPCGKAMFKQTKILSSLQYGIVVKKLGSVSLFHCEVRGNCLDNIAAEEGGTVDLL